MIAFLVSLIGHLRGGLHGMPVRHGRMSEERWGAAEYG
jgi:hypothetical protein